jgi:hypothetical protein
VGNKGSWKPGQPGNPQGRRAEDRKLKLLCRQHTEKAVNALVKHLDSDNPSAVVAAANAILDRAYGKPKQIVDKTVTQRFVDIERAREIRDAFKASLGRSLQ